MAGSVKNREQGVRGETITLDIWFRRYTGGPLVDTDATPTYVIKDPSGTTMASGSGTNVSTGYYNASYSIPSNATVSTLWQIVWTADIGSVAVTGATEYFSVVASGAVEFSQTATISDYWISMVKKPLAYPSVDKVILTDEQIKSYCVYPALREYFTRFPLRDTQEYSLSTSSETEIDFPDDDTYGVLDVRVVGKESLSGEGTSFWDLVYHNSVNGAYNKGGMYGKAGYNPNFRRQSSEYMRSAISSETNRSTFHCRVEEENDKLYIYTNTNGKANITFAKYSSTFDNVRFVYKMDVIHLSSAYLMEHLAQTAGLITNDLAVNVDADTLRGEAKEMRDEIMERWRNTPEIILIRAT